MTKFVTIGATCEAEGHPSECTEIVSGEVLSTTSASILINDSSGTERDLATIETADMHWDSHSHSFDGVCTDDESHDIDPSVHSSSVILNTASGIDSPLYIKEDAVTTDPTSGGNVNIIDSGINNSMSEQP